MTSKVNGAGDLLGGLKQILEVARLLASCSRLWLWEWEDEMRGGQRRVGQRERSRMLNALHA